ncbi:leucine-rich repeat domain-containing protein [Neochlamydia sp. EPS4]|uniref:leucine-rich repeat domain-containing protein n=1 Tax=Neochlamydia sp. EPS4 TaxID=1478175 RepID=UPI0009B59C7C|nr:leucine-rich repeat domain-containing protein [Neochlamydia sp. EPS4]
MHPISSASIESLPNELLLPILEACAVPPLFSVCKRWHHLLATEVMPSLYKQIGKVHVPQGNVKEQALIVDRIYKLEEKLTEAAKVNAIFKQIFTLAKSLSTLESKEKTEEKRGLRLANYASYLLNINRFLLRKKLPGREKYLSREEIKHLPLVELKEKTEEKRGLRLANYASYLLNINRLLAWKKLPGGKEYLSREEIKHLPLEKKGELLRDWIEENCKNLTSLNLSNEGLTYLPPEIGQLSQLQTLDLRGNQLTALPTEIGQLSQLQRLDLSQNQLTSLPAEIGQLSQLRALHLNQNKLTALPAEIWQLPELQTLYLHQNQLTALPAEIGQLSQLQGLYLTQNQLTSLPAEIGQLSQLLWLFLNQNQLTSLPAEIGQLFQLKRLILNQNQLTSLPGEIGQLSQLRALYLNQNQLTSLPVEIGQLFQLTMLRLAENPLKDISEKNKAAFPIVEWP